MINKTVNERLMEQIMRTPHAIRRAMIGERFGRTFGGPHDKGCHMDSQRVDGEPLDGRGPMCEGRPMPDPSRRPMGGSFGEHGSEGMRGFGPREHGPEGMRGFGPREHGPMPGPHPMRGPRPHRHCHGRGTAFARERMLEAISRYEGGVRQKTLTEELKIRPSSVSETISKLEHDGYVRRTVDPDDKRATLITLTEVGEARAAELSDERNEQLAIVFEPLTDEEKEQLIALLQKLTERV